MTWPQFLKRLESALELSPSIHETTAAASAGFALFESAGLAQLRGTVA